MERMKGRLFLAVVIVMSAAYGVWADWPQYLGPNRNAASTETGLARSWPEGGPKVLWTLPLGAGFGGPAVSDGKVYVLDRIKGKQDVLRCVDLVSGKEEWRFAYDAPGSFSAPGSRSVPTIEGNYTYTCGPLGDLYCIDKTTHKAVWNHNIWRDFGGQRLPNWAIAQNPLIHKGSLIVASQTPKAGVVAYNKMTGAVQWTSEPLPGRPSYVTPKIVKIGGDDQLVMMSATARQRRRGRPERGASAGRSANKGPVVGLDPKTGKMLWSYDGWHCAIPISNVTDIGDGRLFITGGYGAGSAMIKVEKKAGAFAVTELYKTQAFGTHVHPAILYKGHLYAHCTTNTRKDGMVCMDIDGNVKWKTKRSPVFDKGGFILADGLILSVDGKAGILYLIEPSPERFKKLASADLLDTNRCWAPLALSDGKLIIRDQKQMKCVVVR